MFEALAKCETRSFDEEIIAQRTRSCRNIARIRVRGEHSMDEQRFITNLEELLEMTPGDLNAQTELAALSQWDSLAFVSFLAMADSEYGVKVAPSNLQRCKTVSDLMSLVKA